MSDEDLEKMMTEMKNLRPTDDSRMQGMENAMTAFEAEYTAETENVAASQGLETERRPTEQSTSTQPVQSFGSEMMSKVKQIFSYNPRSAMMMASCAAALVVGVAMYETLPPYPTSETVTVADNSAIASKAGEIAEAPAPTPDAVSETREGVDDVPIVADEVEAKAAEIIVTAPATVAPEVKIETAPIVDDSTKTPTRTVERVIPSITKTETRRVLKTPASSVERHIPAVTEQVERQVAKEDGSFETVTETVVVTPHSVEYVEVPPVYETVTETVVVQEASTELVEVPATFETKPATAVASPALVFAPPQIERQRAKTTKDRIASLEGATPQFEPPKIDRQSFKIRVGDRDAQPLVRIPPTMPTRAERSGHCRLRFDVAPSGAPFNVMATHCSEKLFERDSIKSVQKWKYIPKIVDGQAVGRSGVETKVTFRLVDEYGNIVPETTPNDQFENYESNPAVSVKETPVSTFSVDVDTASYSFLRAAVNRGQLPPPSSIRLEEMINYFPYDYEAPASADEPFKANVTVTPSPWNADTKLMHIGIKGYVPPKTERPNSNIVFLIDTSGSMNRPNKLPLLINSFKLLLGTLDENDTVSIVTYAGSAGTVLEPTAASETGTIKAALNRLRAGGSTAGAAGLELAYIKAQESFDEDAVNRVILATDGDFNVGFSSPDEMKSFIEDKRKNGIFLSVLGFGMGNYNDHLMQSLAQNGNGVAAYIDSLAEANKVLADEAGSALFTIAKDVKIQVEFNPATISEYRLIGYETRALKRQDFNNDKVDAGEINAGHTVTAIYELTPVGAPRTVDDLRYTNVDVTDTGSDEFAFVKIRHKLPDSDTSTLQTFPVGPEKERVLTGAGDDMRFATAVAAVGQKLRGDPQLNDFSYEDAIALANSAKGDDDKGYRAEFIQMVRLINSLDK